MSKLNLTPAEVETRLAALRGETRANEEEEYLLLECLAKRYYVGGGRGPIRRAFLVRRDAPIEEVEVKCSTVSLDFDGGGLKVRATATKRDHVLDPNPDREVWEWGDPVFSSRELAEAWLLARPH
ncbi:MAG: hypothetical protein WC730_02240 [Patescibacteria group bacterium]|jgi:hypothetical protein